MASFAFFAPGAAELCIVGTMLLLMLGVGAVIFFIVRQTTKTDFPEIRPNLPPCPQCGQPVSPNAVSCPHCGEPLKPDEGNESVE